MIMCLYTFLTGLVVGIIFALLKLPIPAPQALAGVLGIFGIWGGYELVNFLINRFG